MTRVAFYTFGCRLNQAETAIMQQGFDAAAYRVVDYRDAPDVVVVNTCTVTENGDADTRRLVNKLRRINPEVQIALVGCQAQVQKEQLLDLPNVRWVVGNARKMDIAALVEEPAEQPLLLTPTIRKESFTIPFTGFDERHTRANLKIQDGCDFFCSFCEIPYARGRARSREFEDILKEARELSEGGHHELVLTGINIGTYQHQGRQLTEVVAALQELPELWRIRISSIEPTTIGEEVMERMSQGGKLCRYLHIPLQSGSDHVLQAMNRNYSVAEFREFIETAYEAVPELCLGTDVIVGFPGETEADFEETYHLLLDLPFAYFHVFSYSAREHARTAQMTHLEEVSREVIQERSQRLRELSARKRAVYYQQFLGRTVEVLFERQKNGRWSGLTDTYIRVQVESDHDLHNRLLPVVLEEISGAVMAGSLAR